jgi:hypothetical protein
LTERWYAWEDARKLARQNEPELIQEEIFNLHEDNPDLAREKITQIYGQDPNADESSTQTEEEDTESKLSGTYDLKELQSEIDEMSKGENMKKSDANP